MRLKAIEREAGQAALRAEELTRRFGLTGEVPCAGTGLQGQCKLLGDAREAQMLMPNAQGAIRRLADDKTATRRQLKALKARQRELETSPQALAWAEWRESRARSRRAIWSIGGKRRGVQASTLAVRRDRDRVGRPAGARRWCEG
ncbi:hypothetical protein [Verminephrobacter eiseniae]|uniref:hypothetical protein n=1 Tax=Verminephrobacter eiseniae TaxID=364317 RepID=UPI0022386248|nr:hypothetical protein [Verminephrobacter eiseniae]